MNDKHIITYTRDLKVNNKTRQQLDRRFKMAQDIYKTTLITILKRVRKMKKDPRYKQAYKLPKGKARNAILKELNLEYDLQGKFTFSTFANNYRNHRNYSTFIPSDVAGKLGIRAWDAYSKVMFAKGAKHVNLHSELTSIEGKSDTGISIRKEFLKIGTKPNVLMIPVLNVEDEFEEEMLKNKIKYNRITRKRHNGRWEYQIQTIFEGQPIIKPYKPLKGAVGIDIGTSTIALSSHYQTELLELAPGIDKKQDEIRRLQRKLDRQRRANNPQNYNENGTISKGRKTWVDSKRYLKTKSQLQDIKQKQASQRLLAHKTLANSVVKMGDYFVVEKMSFKGLQARSKETKISEKTNRFVSKKRFGATLAHKAPASLILLIKQKAEAENKEFITANTIKIKASQLDHITGLYTKASLSKRAKTVGEELVQRDLYSAFILQHVKNDGVTVDLKSCDSDFKNFLRNQKVTMNELQTTLKSTGLERFEKMLLNND